MWCQPTQPPTAASATRPSTTLDLQPRHHDHQRAGDRDQRAGAQIRLHHDQARGHQDQHRQQHQRQRAGRQRSLMQVPRTHHRHGELHDFRGLEAQHSQIEPALRALADGTHAGDDEAAGRRRADTATATGAAGNWD